MAGDFPPEQPKDFQYGSSKQISNPDGVAAPPLPYTSPDSGSTSNKKVGCWVAGCLGSLLLGVLLVIAMGFGGYWWFTQQVEKYTDTEPAPMPTVEMEAEEVADLQNKIDSFFKQAMPESDEARGVEEAGTKELAPPQELVLTADQINGLLQSNKNLADRAYVEIEEGRILAKVTIPTDQIPGGAGRHFNADAEVEVSLQNGVLLIQIVDAKVKGEPLPEEFAKELTKQNLAEELYKDASAAKMLQRFESVEVVDDTVRMRLKKPEQASKTSDQTSASRSAADVTSETNGDVSAEEELPVVPAGQ